MSLIFASVVLGGAAGGVAGLNTQHVRDLVGGILEDVSAILQSFEGGPDDPKSPVTNHQTLAEDSARLDAATRKAQALATELHDLQPAVQDGGQ